MFEHILDQAGTTAATPASILVAARALGSCVSENGQWTESPKRVIVTNIIRNEPPQPVPATQIGNHATPGSGVAFVGADAFCRPAPPEAGDNPSPGAESNDESHTASEAGTDKNISSSCASLPRDVVAGAPSFATGLRRAAQSEEVAKGGSFPSVPEQTDALSGQRSLSSAIEMNDENASSVKGSNRHPSSDEQNIAGKDSSSRACPDSFVGAPHPPCPERIRERGDVTPASSSEIRNSPNSSESKDSPFSNR